MIERAGALGIEFEPGDVERLGRFLGLLLEANRSVNLTAIRERDAAWERHILDALALLPVVASVEPAEPDQPLRLVDVGSGGGLPGIPLAICMPGLEVTLLEATGKKASFLELAASALELANVRVVNERAEHAGRWSTRQHPSLRETFDIAAARAVGHTAVVAELCVPLVRVGGLVVLVKGERADEELAEAGAALELLGATHVETIPTPTGRLVVLEKTRPTARDYPRRDGEPKRRPLGLGS